MAKRIAQSTNAPPELVVSRKAASEQLTQRIILGEELAKRKIQNYESVQQLQKDLTIWNDYNRELLGRIFSSDRFAIDYGVAGRYLGSYMDDEDLFEIVDEIHQEIASKLECLESLLARLDLIPEPQPEPVVMPIRAAETKGPGTVTSSVFVVHGHDEAARESVARYLTQLGLHPVILHEQPNSGHTIIEKLENQASIGFVVVLLTADDVGASKTSEGELRPRARQNVILELGYFIGKLGRKAVCALYREGVELPSDFDGVAYIVLDTSGGWKLLLARELRSAGFAVDLNTIA